MTRNLSGEWNIFLFCWYREEAGLIFQTSMEFGGAWTTRGSDVTP